MKQEKILTFIVDVENNKAYAKTIENSLENFYKIINCNLVDIIVRKIGEKEFTFIIDDEGALKDNPKISAISKNNKPFFCGNLIIASSDNPEGNEEPLKNEDVDYIRKYVKMALINGSNKPQIILTECE